MFSTQDMYVSCGVSLVFCGFDMEKQTTLDFCFFPDIYYQPVSKKQHIFCLSNYIYVHIYTIHCIFAQWQSPQKITLVDQVYAGKNKDNPIIFAQVSVYFVRLGNAERTSKENEYIQKNMI